MTNTFFLSYARNFDRINMGGTHPRGLNVVRAYELRRFRDCLGAKRRNVFGVCLISAGCSGRLFRMPPTNYC